MIDFNKRALGGATLHPIRVAVLDSGVNPQHSHVEGVEGGAWITGGPDGGAQVLEGVHPDGLGHGTAVAGVIRWFAPRCKLYSVKVFERTLSTRLSILLQGLQWAIEQHVDIINLSLGTANHRHLPPLATLCRQAVEQGTLVVAAAEGRQCYPAVLPTVIGVSADARCGPTQTFYVEGDAVEFRALGQPRPLDRFPSRQNFQGCSFAAARVSGLAAAFLGKEPGADLRRLRAALVAHSHPLARSKNATVHPGETG